MADNDIKIKISATNDTKAASDAAANDIKKVGKAADEANKEGSKSTSSLKDNWALMITGINQGVQLAQAAIEVFKKALDFSVQGAQIERLQESSQMMARSVGLDMDDIVESVREASMGTVSDLDIMTSATKAMMLGVGGSAEELGQLMEVAAIRGRAMGLSTTQAFSDIVTGIGRQSKMILDNLGIVLNLEQVYTDYALSLGKTSTQLTDIEKKQAMVNAVIADTQALLEESGGLMEDNLTKWEQMLAAQKNYWDNVKSGTSTGSVAWASFFEDFYTDAITYGQTQELMLQLSKLVFDGVVDGTVSVMEADQALKYVLLGDYQALLDWLYANELIPPALDAEAQSTENLKSTLDDLQGSFSEAADVINNDLIKAYKDLESAQAGWRESVGGDIASAFEKLAEEAGLSTDEMIARLGLVDEAFGTNKAYEFELGLKTDELAALLLSDPEAFMAQAQQFEDYFMPLDEAVAESQLVVDELQQSLNELERTYTARVDVLFNNTGHNWDYLDELENLNNPLDVMVPQGMNSAPFAPDAATSSAPVTVVINAQNNFADAVWVDRELAPLIKRAVQQSNRGR